MGPLYAYFLGGIYSIFGHDWLLVRLVQIVVGSASCVLVYIVGKRFFRAGVGRLAGIIAALTRLSGADYGLDESRWRR